MKKNLIFLLFIFSQIASAQKDFEKNFASLRLTTLEQKTFSFEEIKKNTASVFVFLLPDCPASQSYSLTLNQFNEKFKPGGIHFYGVFPGNFYTVTEMKEYQSNYHIQFLLLTDPGNKLVKSFGAKVAPEVFVVDNSGQTLYRGRIDDWMYAVGKKRKIITTHELLDALNAIVQHQPVKIRETKAVGCVID